MNARGVRVSLGSLRVSHPCHEAGGTRRRRRRRAVSAVETPASGAPTAAAAAGYISAAAARPVRTWPANQGFFPPGATGLFLVVRILRLTILRKC